jgi:hypothetical protein
MCHALSLEARMKKSLLAVAVAAAVSVLGLPAAPALAGNLSSYEDASWYGKYLAVSGTGASTTCYPSSLASKKAGGNVDASNECGSQSETFIAVDHANSSHVVAGSNEIQRLPMHAMSSADGGVTFVGSDLPLPPPLTSGGFDFGSDPTIAFDSHGNAYYGYIIVFFSAGGSINGTEMAVAKSTDAGRTWSSTYFAPRTGTAQFNDKPMIAVDTSATHRDRIYIAWDNATGNSSSTKNGNNVVLSHSDNGVQFSSPVSVSGSFTGRTGGIGADPYVTPAGVLHVAWQDTVHGAIVDVASADGGSTFKASHPVASVNGFDFGVAAQSSRRALVYPACGATSAELVCSYTNGSDAATTVYVARSTDGGDTWTSSAVASGGDQFNQWLAVDGPHVDVAYYDTGTHGAPATTFTLARSTDGGQTFKATAVATAPTDESCCAPSVDSGNQYGDYEGLAVAGGVAHPVWTDRRQSVIDAGLGEEVFTATLPS